MIEIISTELSLLDKIRKISEHYQRAFEKFKGLLEEGK